MAPRSEFSVDQIRDKARKDILYLLEGVSTTDTAPQQKPPRLRVGSWLANMDILHPVTGPWQEKRRLRSQSGRAHRHHCPSRHPPRVRRRQVLHLRKQQCRHHTAQCHLHCAGRMWKTRRVYSRSVMISIPRLVAGTPCPY